MSESLVGKTIGKYQIVEPLGRGGMAEVHKAYQPSLDRFVAIKLMHAFLADDKDFLGRFQREARAVGRLRHPNIVQVHDFDVANGIYYMVMEFIDGYTLKQKLQDLAENNQILPLKTAISITRDVASALSYAHEREMVHRDIKPANIMIDKDGQVILTDFGIAKILSGPQYTASGAMIGTPAYMAPEQGLGEPGDARSDIYSLGTVLFQMATGQLPFDADTPLAIVLKHVNDPLPIPSNLNPALPQDLERIIFKSMAKNPDDRYQSADEMIAHLDRFQSGLAVPESETATRLGAAGSAATIMATPPPIHGTPPPIHGTPPPIQATPPPMQATPVPATTAIKSGRPKWLLPVLGIGFLIAAVLVIGTVAAMSGIFSPDPTATPTLAQQAIVVATDTPAPDATTAVPTNTHTPEPDPATLSPEQMTATRVADLDSIATSMAQVAATQTADAPTFTPTASATPSITPTPAPECEYNYDLVAFFTYNSLNTYNQASNQTTAPIESRFSFTVRLENTGTCPWPAGTQLALREGVALGDEDGITLESTTGVGETADFGTVMESGDDVGSVRTTWALVLPDGNPIGEELVTTIYLYQPATPTPITPTTAPQPPTATPAQETTGPIDFNYEVHNCEYAGDQWRCWLTLMPYGGIGQPYTFFIFDADQPSRYYGGNQDHLIQSRRCFPWVHEIKIQDDGGNSLSKNVHISPDSYFAGGCTEP